ncbi:MAG: carbohydrate binding family 9 domain-containing protein [Bacteroidales bacterium]|nr:carbohydrate binding family 9 domain-containing protein [Bacteroidales bacterium]
MPQHISSHLMRFLVFILFFLVTVKSGFAQYSEPKVISANKISEKIKFDGQLNDSIWQKITPVNNFTQRDLNFGEPVTEKTEVSVAYDKDNLYFGIWCYQKTKITAKNMNIDFDYESDDNFQIMISPFNDSRSGYLFIINPNGARADIQIFGIEDGNEDWNGVWDAKTTITTDGWFAEVVIPFSTFQFKKGNNLNWAINFERDIVSKNEQALWQGWSRDNSIFAVVKAGTLINLTDISYAKHFELKPYMLTGWHYDDVEGNDYPIKIGGDLNINLTPTLKLNLTSFTDFAQVEADRIPVNLSRFSVYYPEKRQFFLESSDIFSYYLGDRNSAFYSREIGIEEGQSVPIIAGARLFGKVKKSNIGFLNIQEANIDTILTKNNIIFRYKHDIGKQSYIGGIFTNVFDNEHSNQVIGIDATYQTSNFLKDKNFTIGAKLTTSTENFELQEDAFTYRIFSDYPNDLIDNYMAFGTMQRNFNPELGYIRRSDYDSYTWYFRLTPRVFNKYGIKRLILKPWGFTLYNTHSTGELESFHNETRPFGAILNSGERFEFNFIQNYDRIDDAFELTDEISIPTGKYWMYNYEIQLETYNARRIWSELLYNWGGFYTGTIRTLELSLGININKHFNLNADYSWNEVKLAEGKIITHEIASYLNYAFTTKLNFSLFGQFNSLDELMIYNIRFHWIPKVGSDLYFVYNIGYEEPIKQIEYLKPQTTGAVVKIIYRLTF